MFCQRPQHNQPRGRPSSGNAMLLPVTQSPPGYCTCRFGFRDCGRPNRRVRGRRRVRIQDWIDHPLRLRSGDTSGQHICRVARGVIRHHRRCIRPSHGSGSGRGEEGCRAVPPDRSYVHAHRGSSTSRQILRAAEAAGAEGRASVWPAHHASATPVGSPAARERAAELQPGCFVRARLIRYGRTAAPVHVSHLCQETRG